MEHRVSQLAQFCATDFCLSDMDGAPEAPAVSAVFTDRRHLCHLSDNSAVCLRAQTE